MDSSVAEPSDRNDIELGLVTHWPTVYAAIGVAGTVFLGLAAVGVLAALQPTQAPEATEPMAAVVPAPPPRPRGLAVKTVNPVTPPAVVVEEPASEPPTVTPPPAPPPAPVRVATAVTPIIRVSDPAPKPEPSPAPPAPPPEFALFTDLQAHAHEIDLDAVPGTVAKLLGKSPEDRRGRSAAQRTPQEAGSDPSPEGTGGIVNLMARRSDLTGLAMRGAKECKAPPTAAAEIQEVSTGLRQIQACLPPCSAPLHYDPRDQLSHYDAVRYYECNISDNENRNKKLVALLSKHRDWLKEETVSTLAQMLQTEDAPVRLHLTTMLASIKGRPASQALARQALFDLTEEVRGAAVDALRDRPAEEYRQILLDGFRHPWPPVAEHAARALTALEDHDAVKDLKAMLDLPAPTAPTLNENKKWVVAEVVKVNHLRNCLLCHAPSLSEKDPMCAAVPKPGQELPPVYRGVRDGDVIRADVTYLRQDFSLLQTVADPGPWPVQQRFDYLVRRRELTDQEVIDMVDAGAAPSLSYPQRAAVLHALEKLANADDNWPIEKVGLGP